MIVSSVFHEAESSIEPQSLGRVCDPVGIAAGPTAIDAAPQRLHFGFRLRLVDKLQPIGGGSGRGHPLSGTWETWMAPNVTADLDGDLVSHGGQMSKLFDALTRSLLEKYPADWLNQLGLIHGEPVRVMNSDLSSVTAE